MYFFFKNTLQTLIGVPVIVVLTSFGIVFYLLLSFLSLCILKLAWAKHNLYVAGSLLVMLVGYVIIGFLALVDLMSGRNRAF